MSLGEFIGSLAAPSVVLSWSRRCVLGWAGHTVFLTPRPSSSGRAHLQGGLGVQTWERTLGGHALRVAKGRFCARVVPGG